MKLFFLLLFKVTFKQPANYANTASNWRSTDLLHVRVNEAYINYFSIQSIICTEGGITIVYDLSNQTSNPHIPFLNADQVSSNMQESTFKLNYNAHQQSTLHGFPAKIEG